MESQPTPPPDPLAPVDVTTVVSKKKSNFLYIILGFLIIVGAGIGYFILLPKTDIPEVIPEIKPTVIPTTTPTPINSGTVSAVSGNSDIQLDKDSQSLDQTLSNLETETNNIDQGLNDKAIDLTY